MAIRTPTTIVKIPGNYFVDGKEQTVGQNIEAGCVSIVVMRNLTGRGKRYALRICDLSICACA